MPKEGAKAPFLLFAIQVKIIRMNIFMNNFEN